METAKEDELMAMENIFGPEEFCRSKTSLGGVMKVSPQLPYDFRIIQKGEINKEYGVQFLPPLVVNVDLPESYPSHSSPAFRLSCQWLRHNQLSRVCSHLDELWQDSGGEPVLFSWFQFLREVLLDFLSIKSPWEIPCVEEPDLGSLLQDTDSRDPRVTTAASTDTGLHHWLLDHDRKMRQKAFEGQSFDCGICFSAKSGLDCHRFKGCEHVFCRDCISNVFKIAIEEGRVLQFNCLNTDCQSMATLSEVKDLVGVELFSRCDQLLLQKTLDCMADVVYCPRPSCSSPVVQEPEESWAFCTSCAFAFCTKCQQGYHGVNACPLDVHSDPSGAEASGYELPNANIEEDEMPWEAYEKVLPWCRKQKERRLFGAHDTSNWIKNNTQKCPKCSVRIEKNGGCNMMLCTHCLARFCWECREVLEAIFTCHVCKFD